MTAAEVVGKIGPSRAIHLSKIVDLSTEKRLVLVMVSV